MLNQKGFSSALIIVILIFIVGYGAGMYYFGVKKGESYTSRSSENAQNNLFIGTTYTAELPSNFYTFYRDGNDFAATNKKWDGKPAFPSVGITTYLGDIPPGMKLEQWLEKVGSTRDWSEFSNTNIPCKDAIESLRIENGRVPYGGNDGHLSGDECLFFNVKNIKKINLPNLEKDKTKYQHDLEVVEFNSTGSANSGMIGTFTLVTFGTGYIWQIDKREFAVSDEKDGIDQAYQLLKKSLKIN